MYVKLFGSILNSSVWQETHATRLVWITLLLLADEDGFVKSSVGGLAHQARVNRDEAEAALATFQSPDPDSQTSDHDGRRIERVEGGWMVLNYGKYRETRTRKQVTAANRQARKRKKDNEITADGADGERDMSRSSRSVTAIASASASVSGSSVVQEQTAVNARADEPTLTAHFADPDHKAAYLGYWRVAKMPVTFDASVRAVALGMRGKAYDWPTIGASLVAMGSAGATFSELLLVGYAKKLVTATPAVPAWAGMTWEEEKAARDRGDIF